MSIFRRREESTPPAGGAPDADAAPTTVPVARDPDLAVPPFRPAISPSPSQEPVAMNLPPKPSHAPVGVGVPPRPPVNAGAAPSSPPLTTRAPAPAPAAMPDRRTMVVGRGISLQGTVTDAERLVVEGTVESQMLQAAELLISDAGVFKGEVEVEDAEIAGVFDGTLTARGNLTIRSSGRVLGVARCRRLQVEEGGQLSGRMEMLSDNAAPSYTPAPLVPSHSEV